MKKLFYAWVVLFNTIAFGQNLEKIAADITAEGKVLYRSEMASWYGTDIFLEQYKNDKSNIGGYFSYSDGNLSKCIFFSASENPVVIGTIIFDSTFNTKTASYRIEERDFNSTEFDLYILRKTASKAMLNDTLFKQYSNTNFNLIPLIWKGEKKVYVLTGPTQNDVVIFGNDYLLTFDKNNRLQKTKKIHRSIIPIYKADESENETAIASAHVHLPETGDFITPTDVCTLMLYEKFTPWENHYVKSEKYMSIWNCKTDRLLIMTQKALDKIEKDQKKRH